MAKESIQTPSVYQYYYYYFLSKLSSRKSLNFRISFLLYEEKRYSEKLQISSKAKRNGDEQTRQHKQEEAPQPVHWNEVQLQDVPICQTQVRSINMQPRIKIRFFSLFFFLVLSFIFLIYLTPNKQFYMLAFDYQCNV